MTVSETIKSELKDACTRIVKLLGLRQGSIEVHCHKGEPKQVHVHDKSIKFEDSKMCPPGEVYKTE
jgi:hypothetical protein